MKIKFVCNYTVKSIDGDSYEKGQTVDLATHSAMHFINRGVAVEVESDVKQAPTPKTRRKTVADT